MSVKITHHNEKRNTSIRDFILAVTLPLLLVGALGYVIGSNQSGDAVKNATALSKLRAEYGELRDEHEALNTYIIQIDSLKKIMDEKINVLDKAKREAFAATEVSIVGEEPIAEWWGDVRENSVFFKRELADVRGAAEGALILSRQQIAIPEELFEDYIDSNTEAFNTARQCRLRTGSNNNKCLAELDEQANLHRDEITDVKRELTQANSRVDDLTRDKERLMDQLSNTGKVVCPDNGDKKALIKNGAAEINAAVQGIDLERGFLNIKRRDFEKVKEVQTEVDRLTTQVRDAASEID